jgi:hypothetical protein
VSVVTRLRDGRAGFDSRQRQGISSSSPGPERLWGPASLPSNGYCGGGGDLSLVVKRPRHEADHSPLSSAQVKNGGVIPPLPYVVVAWCFVK